MRKHILAVTAGGLLLGAAGIASAQDVAVATPAPPAPKSTVVVFTEKGDRALSPTALASIRSAAGKARDAHVVMLSGSPRTMGVVRDELVRQGVSASSIVARNDAASPLPKPHDGLSDPADRHVEIAF